MQKLEIEKIIVSTYGLGEGYLSEYLRSPSNINSHRLNIKKINDYTKDQLNTHDLPNKTNEYYACINKLYIITPPEYQVIIHANSIIEISYT